MTTNMAMLNAFNIVIKTLRKHSRNWKIDRKYILVILISKWSQVFCSICFFCYLYIKEIKCIYAHIINYNTHINMNKRWNVKKRWSENELLIFCIIAYTRISEIHACGIWIFILSFLAFIFFFISLFYVCRSGVFALSFYDF